MKSFKSFIHINYLIKMSAFFVSADKGAEAEGDKPADSAAAEDDGDKPKNAATATSGISGLSSAFFSSFGKLFGKFLGAKLGISRFRPSIRLYDS